jgi:hypothetical protein
MSQCRTARRSLSSGEGYHCTFGGATTPRLFCGFKLELSQNYHVGRDATLRGNSSKQAQFTAEALSRQVSIFTNLHRRPA